MKSSALSGKKIISIILSVALTMQVGLSLAREKAGAADESTGSITVSSGTVSLSTSGGGGNVGFVISEDSNGGYVITCDSPETADDAEKRTGYISSLDVGIVGTCQINADLSGALVLSSEYGSAVIGGGYTYTCTGLYASPAGVLKVDGTLNLSDFKSSDYTGYESRLVIINNGVISAPNIDITDTTYLNHNGSSVYKISNSFTKGGEDFAGKVVATSASAAIKSAGGSFVLEYNGNSITVEGDVDTTVGDLMLNATSASFDFPAGNPMNSFVYGVDYDFDDYISVSPASYTGTPYVEYALNEAGTAASFSTTKPVDPGSYYARIVVPEDGDFYASTSSLHPYTISYLDLDEALFPNTTDKYVSFDNVVNGSYVNDVLLVSPAPGFQIACSHAGSGAYYNQLEIAYDDIYDGDSLNNSVTFSFQRLSDGATTDNVALSAVCPGIADIVFDTFDPEIEIISADGAETSLSDGGEINADEVVFYVWDDTLKEIYINGTLTYDEDDFSDGYLEMTFNSVAGTASDYVIRAVDVFDQEATFEFTLYPPTVDPTLTVTLPDSIYVGDDYDVTVDTNSDGNVTITYYVKDSDTPLADKPTAAGEYICSVNVAETNLYNGAGSNVEYVILRHTGSATVSVTQPLYVGQEYTPTVDTDSDGVPVITYRYNDEDGTPVSEDQPTAAGNYTVLVTIPQTPSYYPLYPTTDFSIIKRDATATISVPNSVIGQVYSPTYSTTSDGADQAVIEYKVQGADDRTYSLDQPTDAGSYTARYTVPETNAYLGTFATADFTISKLTATATVSVPSTIYGESYSPSLETNSDGFDRAVYEYKLQGASDSDFTTTAPSAVGEYILRVTVPETDTYSAVSATATFTISKRTPTLTVTVSNVYVGTTYAPSVTTDSNMASSAVIEYKEKAAPDTAYSTVKPTTYGEYIVRVSVPASDIYFAASETAEFKISYLESPETAFDIEGTEGNNGYYTSDVELKAPEGYEISSSYNGTYSASITYNENIRNVYLKRKSDGALTAAIAIVNRPKIDMAAPEITSMEGALENGSVYYAQNFEFSATDANLKTLTINGQDVDLSTLVGNKITLTAGYGIKTFLIIAEDEAGNISKVQFTLMAEWLREKIIPADLELPLVIDDFYNLAAGEWTVNDDTTVYNGGIPIYVSENGDYTFTKVG